MPPDVFFEIVKEPSIKDLKPRTVNIVEAHDWRAEIMTYLRGHYEPQDELEEKRLRQRARGYTIVNGELYKFGVTEPWIRCITYGKGVELLKEIHSEFCGAHIGTRALASKAIKQGFSWPSINFDAKKLVQECEACQKNSESVEPTIYASSSNSTIMASTNVGNGFGRPIANSSRKLQVRSSGS
jgi:hypothetical protein